MIDASLALRTAYEKLLKDLQYAGKPVKLYDMQATNDAQGYYVIIGPWQSRNLSVKDNFHQSGQINLDVVARQPVGINSRRPTSEIANLITTLLKPNRTAEVLEVEGFESWNTIIERVMDAPTLTSTDTIIRKIITVSHTLKQL
jgi:hypothetical protein